MKGPRLIALAVVGLWMAAGCQQGLAGRLPAGGPDFLLIAMTGLALYCNRRGGAVLGFSAGLLEGALADANLPAYVITRSIAGFACASLRALEFEPSPLVAALATVLVTLVAQFGLMFVAPPQRILPFVLATIGSAVVNGVLAMPLHLVIRRFSDPYSR